MKKFIIVIFTVLFLSLMFIGGYFGLEYSKFKSDNPGATLKYVAKLLFLKGYTANDFFNYSNLNPSDKHIKKNIVKISSK